jgi:hypothetical protein
MNLRATFGRLAMRVLGDLCQRLTDQQLVFFTLSFSELRQGMGENFFDVAHGAIRETELEPHFGLDARAFASTFAMNSSSPLAATS